MDIPDNQLSNRYCFSLSTFSPTGELKQVEYANQCSMMASPAVGIFTRNGIVMIADKSPTSRLLVRDSYSQLEKVGTHAAVTYAGLAPDFRVLTKSIQKSAIMYNVVHDGVMPVSSILSDLTNKMQMFTQSSGVRPYGLSILLAGWDRMGGRLYHLDASGSHSAVEASAVGRGASRRMSFLKKHYNRHLSLNEIIRLAIRAIHLGYDCGLPADSLQMATITERGFRQWDRYATSELIFQEKLIE